MILSDLLPVVALFEYYYSDASICMILDLILGIGCFAVLLFPSVQLNYGSFSVGRAGCSCFYIGNSLDILVISSRNFTMFGKKNESQW